MENSKQVSGRMQEITADGRLQFPCSACGATLSFQAGQSALICEHCGHKEEIAASKDGVQEHAFDEYTQSKAIGWGTTAKSFDCKTCGAKTTVEATVASFSCPFCSSNQVDAVQVSGRMRPESLIPFGIDQRDAGKRFQAWLHGLWFRPTALKKLANLERMYGIYVPHWTFDSLTHSSWEAERGDHYYETESYRDAQGHSQTRRVQKTRWHWVNGTHRAFFNDVLVAATGSVNAELLATIYPFDTAKLVAYDPRYLAGWAAEDYQREMPKCWPQAKEFMDAQIRSASAQKIGGDTYRNLTVHTQYLNQTYKLCLLPVWVTSYRYRNKLYSCLLNGQTGRVGGVAPYSWLKISLAVLLVVLAVAGLIFLTSGT